MKVYIVTKDPFPNGMAATNRIRCYARALHDGGIECEVIVGGCSELRKGEIKNTEARGIYEGVPFRYIGESTTDTRPALVRRFAQFIRLLKTERFLNRNLQKGDVLFLYMRGKVKTMLRFMEIAHKREAFCVRDLCELPMGTREETELAIRLRKLTLEKQFPKLDGVISISEALLNLSQTYTLSTCKHIKVPIMVEYEHYNIDKSPSETEVPFIFHAGTLFQQKDGILGMIEAFGIAKQRLQKPIKYVLTSCIEASPQAQEIRYLIEKFHLENDIEFVGYLSREQIREYLSKATLVISNRPRSKQDYYGFSTKVGEYLASGTPLITTRWGEVVNWLKNGENAYIIEPGNTEALADAIVKVFNEPADAKRIGIGGKAVCLECFDYRNWSQPLVDFFNRLGN